MNKAFSAALIVCFSVFWAAAQTRVGVRLAAEARVESNLIALGDIAQISGNGEKAEKLKAISLGYAPNIGLAREIPREKIRLAIAAAGFEPGEFSLEAPPVVRISRAGQSIAQDQIREAVEKTVLGQFAENGIEARIVRLELPDRIDVPIGKVELRANVANIQNPFAPFALSIEIRVGDAVVRRQPVNVEIEAFAEIFVAANDLAAGSKIDKSNVRLERRRLEKPLAIYLRDAAKLRGLKSIRNLPGGAPLTADAFISDVVVRPGDLVRIVGQAGRLQIAVNGVARSGGKIGARIAVKNSQSNLIVQATVVDEGIVKVFF